MLAQFAFLLASTNRSDPNTDLVTGKVELVSELKNVRAGQPFKVGIRLMPSPGWHTYWMNPGDSGSPTIVKWRLPKGWTVGPYQWPAPSRILTGGIVSYGYEAPTILMTTLTPRQRLARAWSNLRAGLTGSHVRHRCASRQREISN